MAQHSIRKQLGRRVLSCILSASVMLGTLPALAVGETAPTVVPIKTGVSYQDTEGHWASEAIEIWSDRGVFQGYNGLFRPNDPITRGELAVALDRVMRYQNKVTEDPFTDLDQSYYTDAILRTTEAGVLQGSDGLVRPRDNITKEETAVMITRAFGIAGENASQPFQDQGNISSWAVGQVSALKNRGYVKGTPDGSFLPQDSITRAEVVTILNGCVADYITQPGEYTISRNGVVIVAASPVTITNSTITDNLIATGDIASDAAITLKNTQVKGENISVSKNDGVFQTVSEAEPTKKPGGGGSGGGSSGGGGGGSTPTPKTELALQANSRNIVSIDNEAKAITVTPNTTAQELLAQLGSNDARPITCTVTGKSGMDVLAADDTVDADGAGTYTVRVNSLRVAEPLAAKGAVRDIVVEYTIDRTTAEREALYGTVEIKLPDGITANAGDTINVAGRGDIALTQDALENSEDGAYKYTAKNYAFANLSISADGRTVTYADGDFRPSNGTDIILTLKGKTVPAADSVFEAIFTPEGGTAETAQATLKVVDGPANLKRVLTEDSYTDFTKVKLTWEGGDAQLMASKDLGAWTKLADVTGNTADVAVDANAYYRFQLVSAAGESNVLGYYSKALAVTDMGAVADGTTDDSAAINAAIAAVARTGGGLVTFPANKTFASNSIHLLSNVHLYLDENVELKALNGLDAYEPMNEPFSSGQDFGHSQFRASLLWAERQENIHVTCNNATINGDGNLVTGTISEADKGKKGDKTFSFKLCKDIEVSGVSKDAPLTFLSYGHFAFIATGCDDVTVSNLYVGDLDNQRDVVNFMQCNNTSATHVTVLKCSNDIIKLGSDYAIGFIRGVKGTYVEDVHANYIGGGNVFQLGSETLGDFEDLIIKNVSIRDNADKAGLGFCVNDGGTVRNVTIEDVDLSHCTGGITFMASDRSSRVPAEIARPGTIDNVTITNAKLSHNQGGSGAIPVIISGFRAHRTTDNGAMTLGTVYPVTNITLNNVSIEASADYAQTLEHADNDIADVGAGGCYRPSSYPNAKTLPAYALLVTKASGVTIDGGALTFEDTADNNRYALVADYVTDLKVKDMSMMQGSKIGGAIQVRGNSSYTLENITVQPFADATDDISYTVNQTATTVDASDRNNWVVYGGETNVVNVYMSKLHPNIVSLVGTTVTVSAGTTWQQLQDQLLSLHGRLALEMNGAAADAEVQNGATFTATAKGGAQETFTVVIEGAQANALVELADELELAQEENTGIEDVPPAFEEVIGDGDEEDVPPASEEETGDSNTEDAPPASEEGVGDSNTEDVPPASEEEVEDSNTEDVPPASEKEVEEGDTQDDPSASL